MNTTRRQAIADSDNVTELPMPYGKTIRREDAGEFLLPISAYTDLIGGPIHNREYAIEDLIVDPDAEWQDGALVVFQLKGSAPRLTAIYWTGRDANGRYVPKGDPRECYQFAFGLRVPRNESLRIVRIIGCLVGEPRRIPVVG